MEIDAVKHGPLTPEERQRRFHEGLCLYCGKGKHLASECPNKSDKAKKRPPPAKASSSKGGKA